MIYGMCTSVVYFHFAINSAGSYILLIFSCTTIASIFTSSNALLVTTAHVKMKQYP